MLSFKSYLNEVAFKYEEVKRMPFVINNIKAGIPLKLGALGDDGEVKIKYDDEIKKLEDLGPSLSTAKGVKFTGENNVVYRYTQFFKGDFSGFGSGGEDISGADWEKIICVAYNMLSKNVTKDEAAKLAEISKYPDNLHLKINTGFDIVKTGFKSINGIMKHYGSDKSELTNEWDEFFIKSTGNPAGPSTKTPKTDMFINTQRISLKKEGGSQLMSGGEAESLATLAFAYKNTPEKIKTDEFDKAWLKLQKDIEANFTKVSGASISDIKREIKQGHKGGIIDIVQQALKNQSVMTDSINSIMQNKEIKYSVVEEAMTGKSKFKNTIAAANCMMIFNESGYGKVKEIDGSVISHYASKTKFSISFKSAGGKSWTALKAIYLESEENIWNNIINEALDEAEIINEGIFSGIKAFLSNFISILWNKIKKYLAKGLEYVYELLGISMRANIDLTF